MYNVEKTVLFDTGKADIKPGTAEALKQITGSIEQHYNASQVHVMGFADSHGAKDYNNDLSEKRAEAVKNYLVTGNTVAVRMSAEPMGEAMPVTSNTTAAGRQENRRVEIAVRTKQPHRRNLHRRLQPKQNPCHSQHGFCFILSIAYNIDFK